MTFPHILWRFYWLTGTGQNDKSSLMLINTKSVLYDAVTHSPSYSPTIVILVIIKYQFTDKRTNELRCI